MTGMEKCKNSIYDLPEFSKVLLNGYSRIH